MINNVSDAVKNLPTRGSRNTYRGGSVDQRNLNILTNGTLKQKALLQEGEGRFRKTKGHQLKKTIGSDVVTMLEPWYGEYYAIAYGTTTGIYHRASDTVTAIKTDHTLSDDFYGGVYGNRFYLTNGGEKVGYLTITLNYDNQSADFTAGKKITGGTSGATAVIVSDSDGGTTGTLTLRDVVGVFADNEEITDDNGTPGTADVNGTLSGAFTELSNAPYAKHLIVGKKRLYASNIVGSAPDPSTTWVSHADVGSGIPDTWAEDEVPPINDPYRTRWGGAGAVNAVIEEGEQVVRFLEDGIHAYRLLYEADGSGGIDQRVEDIFTSRDFGGYKAVSTKYGIFYTNPNGIYLLSGGNGTTLEQANIMAQFSEENIGKYDFSDADLKYLPTKDLLIITCRLESSTNNAVLIYNIPRQQMSTRDGVTFKRFALTPDKQTLLATDATTGKIYSYLTGYDDVGKEIFTEMEKEEAFGDVYAVKTLHDLAIHGKIGQDTTVRIEIDVWDDSYRFQANKHVFEWTLDSVLMASQNGYNELGYSEPISEGDGVVTDSIGHFRVYIPRFTKLRFRIKESSMLPFELYSVSFGDIRGLNAVHKQNLSPV